MGELKDLLRWCIEHWKNWGITTIIATAAAAGAWLLARRREWKEARRAKAERTRGFPGSSSLGRPKSLRGTRGMTGGGDPLVRSRELAETLCLDYEKVAVDSLKGLEARGWLRDAGGTLEDPTPSWHVLRR